MRAIATHDGSRCAAVSADVERIVSEPMEVRGDADQTLTLVRREIPLPVRRAARRAVTLLPTVMTTAQFSGEDQAWTGGERA